MKKIWLLVTTLLVCFVVTAQQSRLPKKLNSLSFNIGPSFPISDFASNNSGNENAGYAKTGINVDLNYDHLFSKNVGISINGLYGSHKMDQKIITDFMEMEISGADISHYQYVGLLAGPVFRGTLTPKTDINFKLLGGVGRASSPEASFLGELVAKKDWATSFTWRLTGDLNFQFTKNAFLIAGLSYTQMRPDFKVVILPNDPATETIRMEMHVNTINLNAGVGIKF